MEYQRFESRAEYEQRQIVASTKKIAYCKFSYRDAERYVQVAWRDMVRRGERPRIGPTLCLGVRNGREVDCFRIAQGASRLRQALTKRLERRWNKGFTSWVPALEAVGRSDYRAIGDGDCIGVELNPLAGRRDIWIGSFDNLPPEWAGRFHVVFTNAFDHAYDPELTVACWTRVMKKGGYFILCFPNGQESAPLDPVGGVTLEDVTRLFAGEIIYYRRNGSEWGYTEFILRMP